MLLEPLLILQFLLQHTTAQPVVKIGRTAVNGIDGPFYTEFFGSIPFAKPPIDNLRFRPPISVTSLTSETFDASRVSPGCPQIRSSPSDVPLSEDCLRLNIIRPAGTKSGAKLPVLTWIYGGDFIVGEASTYNGTQLVAHGVARGTPVIFVNFNYRLGSLGFPTGFEAEAQGALNLGLRDQIAALNWIQANIAKFGGDKKRVTLFGESAGAISIADLYLNSNLEKYIHGAIMESGTMGSNRLLKPSDGQRLWEFFLSKVPACATAPVNTTFECLRKVPVDEIALAQQSAIDGAVIGWTPVIDGPGGYIPTLSSTLIAQGKFARVPFISGTTLDEGTLFVPTTINDTASFEAYIASQLPGISDPAELETVVQRMSQLYPDIPALGSPFGTGNETFGLHRDWKRGAAISCDVNFLSVRRGFMQAASRYGVKTYAYLFNEPQTDRGFLGVHHASELPYVYGYDVLKGLLGSFPPSPGFSTLSPLLMDYWISFAESLSPNDGKGLKRPNWRQFTSSETVVLQLKANDLKVIPDDFRVEANDFINRHSPYFGH